MFTTMNDEGEISLVEEPSSDYMYTYADYLKWQFEERLELFRGKIFKLAAPSPRAAGSPRVELMAEEPLAISS